MKVFLKFDYRDQEDREDFERMLKATDMQLAFERVHNEVWRPSWKHGYSDEALQSLIDKLGDDGHQLIEKLHSIYCGIMDEYDINIL